MPITKAGNLEVEETGTVIVSNDDKTIVSISNVVIHISFVNDDGVKESIVKMIPDSPRLLNIIFVNLTSTLGAGVPEPTHFADIEEGYPRRKFKYYFAFWVTQLSNSKYKSLLYTIYKEELAVPDAK